MSFYFIFKQNNHDAPFLQACTANRTRLCERDCSPCRSSNPSSVWLERSVDVMALPAVVLSKHLSLACTLLAHRISETIEHGSNLYVFFECNISLHHATKFVDYLSTFRCSGQIYGGLSNDAIRFRHPNQLNSV